MRHFGRVPAGQNHPVCGKAYDGNRQAQGVQPLRYVPESANCRTLRTHLHLAITVSVPVSLSVYTTEEWAELCTDSTSYAAWIARKGKVIYDQAT